MATGIVTPDPETISLDELRKLAEEEAVKLSTKSEEEPKEEVEEEIEEEIEGFVAERTVDLGDGAGVQVFKGEGETKEAALEDLADKLSTAQLNATKKIRELSAEKKKTTITPEQESLYSAELIATPTVAFKKLFKEVTGMDVEDFKTVTARAKAFQEGQEKKTIADQFVIDHPEFLDNDRNAQRLKKAVALYGEFNIENLEKAYKDLSESGLLEVKAEKAGDGQDKDKPETRIEQKAEVTPSQRTRKASGLSTQRRAAAPMSATLSEDELYAMPLDKLRQLANKQLAESH